MEEQKKGSTWKIIYTSLVLFYMFVALLSDKVGADMVMISALTLLLIPSIISIEEALAGFANEGLLTVLVLFVVAAAISNTGALDWYLGKLLGRPKSVASAQLRLMIPITFISAFLNNTPVVCVMIPIVQRWGKNVGVSPQQLLIPLSFASILGGTCTLIGTSTNLVIVGLLKARYPDDKISNIGLFDLGIYGVPIAMVGIAYILFFSIFLLPGGSKFIAKKKGEEAENPADLDDSILLGARLTKWSAAATRTVKRSGLRDTGGLFLVSVHRAATGNVHRAVGQDFVLNVGDILYFTGLVEGFGAFCEEHGLEVITNEVEDSVTEEQDTDAFSNFPIQLQSGQHEEFEEDQISERFKPSLKFQSLELGVGRLTSIPEVDTDIGVTKQSLLQSEDMERLRYINRIQDVIRGVAVDDDMQSSSKISAINAPSKIVVHVDSKYNSTQTLVVVAVDAPDRPGLLLDISKTLIRMGLNFHKTEAMAIEGRSLSLWRCEVMKDGVSDIEEIWSVLSAMLEVNTGIEAVKRKGIRVIRAVIPKGSQLIGSNATEINFREKYKAAIVAVQREGKAMSEKLSLIRFRVGDILVLQVSDDSPLLVRPPKDFYKKSVDKGKFANIFVKKRFGSFGSISDANSAEQGSDNDANSNEGEDDDSNIQKQSIITKDVNETKESLRQTESGSHPLNDNEDEKQQMFDTAWRDIAVAFDANEHSDSIEPDGISREFLTAMQIRPRSNLSKKTAVELGFNKLPGVFLVSVERPITNNSIKISKSNSFDEEEMTERASKPVSLEEPLEDGDILWFSGTANAIGDLRKIPGMVTFVNAEVKKINEKIHDRRLVQAVISRRSKLVGKTAREARFRSKFGAVVIAVHREGRRVHEHPGRIKLQAGDVLLLEAGPTFLRQSIEKDQSFALLSEVEDSVPPRLKLLIPALFLTVAMLAVYTAGVASLFVCGLVAAMMMCLLGILTQQEIRDAINWEVYITIACAFGIGSALTNSGVAGGIADGFVKLGNAIDIGDAGLYGAVYCGTFLISNIVTNNAAAALIFPIAIDAAEQTGADRKLMSYILMLGASASFMSPFGYTTNLLIYGPGGYKTIDFLRFGTPLQILLMLLSVVVVSADKSRWFVAWIASAVVLLFVSVILTSKIECNFKRSRND